MNLVQTVEAQDTQLEKMHSSAPSKNKIAYFHEKIKQNQKQTKIGLTRVTQDCLSSYLYKICPQRL